MSEKKLCFQFSLFQLIAIVMSTSILLGLTFGAYSGGFTPGESWVVKVRGEVAPTGERLRGDFSTYGFPFNNLERGATWYAGDATDQSVREHVRYCYAGIVFNVILWFLFSCALVLVSRRFLRREACNP